MTPEIIKVQRPLMNISPKAKWIFDNKNRTRREIVPDCSIAPDLLISMRGADKAYFRATWAPDGGWEIGERVEDQAW
jgi:hypothetical protein